MDGLPFLIWRTDYRRKLGSKEHMAEGQTQIQSSNWISKISDGFTELNGWVALTANAGTVA